MCSTLRLVRSAPRCSGPVGGGARRLNVREAGSFELLGVRDAPHRLCGTFRISGMIWWNPRTAAPRRCTGLLSNHANDPS